MSGKRKVRGAALLSTLAKQIRTEVLDGYGIPWDEYTPKLMSWPDGITVDVTFTHGRSGRVLKVSNIWYSASGEILQCGQNYGDLTL